MRSDSVKRSVFHISSLSTRLRYLLFVFVLSLGIISIIGSGGGGGGSGGSHDKTPTSYTQDDFQGIWYLNLEESDRTPEGIGTYVEFSGDEVRHVTVTSGVVGEDDLIEVGFSSAQKGGVCQTRSGYRQGFLLKT